LLEMRASVSCTACLEVAHGNTDWHKKMLKFKVILVVLTLLNPNMTTKLPHHVQMLRESGLNHKINLVTRK